MEEKKSLTKKPHDGREDLVGEHPIGDAGQIILLIIFFVVWILDSFIFKFSILFTDLISVNIRIVLSLLVLITSGYVAKAGLNIIFGEISDKPEVISSGIFKIVRHPIYLGAILFYLAFLIFSFSFSALIIWIVTLFFYQFIAKHEEKLLVEKFGKAYEEYQKSVPMWIPKIKNKNK